VSNFYRLSDLDVIFKTQKTCLLVPRLVVTNIKWNVHTTKNFHQFLQVICNDSAGIK